MASTQGLSHREIQALLAPVSTVSRETVERLEHFVDLFEKWSRSINLIAPSTRAELWTRHVADSLQIYHFHPGAHHWVDLGSGGGFPGAITAIMLAEIGDGWVDLVESNGKKAAFLRLALAETGARGSVHVARIEAAAANLTRPTCVSARALADLDTLLGLASPWLLRDPGHSAWFHKGRDYRSELAKARDRWSFDLVEHRSRLNTESVILQIGSLRAI